MSVIKVYKIVDNDISNDDICDAIVDKFNHQIFSPVNIKLHNTQGLELCCLICDYSNFNWLKWNTI